MDKLAKVLGFGLRPNVRRQGRERHVVATCELPALADVHLAAIGEAPATLLNHYRFLNALDFAFGLFCIAYWRDIFGEPRALRAFLAGLAAGLAAVAGSWLVDGLPSGAFLVFMVVESITGVLTWYPARARSAA